MKYILSIRCFLLGVLFLGAQISASDNNFNEQQDLHIDKTASLPIDFLENGNVLASNKKRNVQAMTDGDDGNRYKKQKFIEIYSRESKPVSPEQQKKINDLLAKIESKPKYNFVPVLSSKIKSGYYATYFNFMGIDFRLLRSNKEVRFAQPEVLNQRVNKLSKQN